MKSAFVLAPLLLAGALCAQEASSKLYRLNFAFHEMENGKSAGTRNYSMLMRTLTNEKLNIGSKVPVPAAPGNSTQYTYIDVGISVRARLEERGEELLLGAEIEASNLAGDRENAGKAAPRVQQMKATFDTVIPLGRTTTVVALDDPAGPKRYEIEVTATKVK
jgi:hypothetical protein